MASGFIALRNGKDWSSRWSGYDWVLETIMNELPTNGDSQELRAWIKYILPSEEAGDVESGFAFWKASGDNESILRIIDVRLMKEKYRDLFWQAVKSLHGRIEELNERLQPQIVDLYQMYEQSLVDEAQAPDRDDDTLNDIFFVGGFNIGIGR